MFKNPLVFLVLFIIAAFSIFKIFEFQFYNQPKWLDGTAVENVLFDSTGSVSLRNVQRAAKTIYGRDSNGTIIPGYFSEFCRIYNNNEDCDSLLAKIKNEGLIIPVYYTSTNHSTIRPGPTRKSIIKYTNGATKFFIILTIPFFLWLSLRYFFKNK